MEETAIEEQTLKRVIDLETLNADFRILDSTLILAYFKYFSSFWKEVFQARTLGKGQPKCQATKKEDVQHLACTFIVFAVLMSRHAHCGITE